MKKLQHHYNLLDLLLRKVRPILGPQKCYLSVLGLTRPLKYKAFTFTEAKSFSSKYHGSESLGGKTHYEILNIRRSATSEEVRDAFLKLSKQYHPDINKNPDNHKHFVKINEAYSILSKPLSRRDYDLSLNAERYIRQQHNASAYRSHGYGTTGDSGHFYYHQSYVHEDGFSSTQQQEYNSGKRLHKALVNFYTLTAFLTIATVAFILQGMHIIYPSATKRTYIYGREVDTHELIMTSEHDGRTIFYYAIPKEDDPEHFEILAVAKKENDQGFEELEKLNNVSKMLSKAETETTQK